MLKLELCCAALLLAMPALAEAQSTASQPQTGTASYYNGGPKSRTATGEPVNSGARTAASRTLPLGSTAKVTNKATGKSTRVRINDRGPVRKDRQIDVSNKAASDLGMKHSGTAPVTVQPETASKPR
jgi:rare lipoprotein A